jgi:hypothetical protein
VEPREDEQFHVPGSSRGADRPGARSRDPH